MSGRSAETINEKKVSGYNCNQDAASDLMKLRGRLIVIASEACHCLESLDLIVSCL